MSSLPHLPGDETLLDMIRAGVNTIPMIVEKFYGRLSGQDRIDGKSRVLNRLNSMEKYGMVRRTDRTVQCGRGRNIAKVWEVVE